MPDDDVDISADEALSKKRIKVAVILLSIIELIVMVAIFYYRRMG